MGEDAALASAWAEMTSPGRRHLEPMDVTGAPSLEQMAAGDWNSARNTERRVRGVGGRGKQTGLRTNRFSLTDGIYG
jgi:hypothetical protein